MPQGKQSQVRFVVAGFTERATATGGQYLEKHWEVLWESYVKNSRDKTHGDFLVLIEGPSGRPVDEWREAKSFAVTPERLHKLEILCPWTPPARHFTVGLK